MTTTITDVDCADDLALMRIVPDRPTIADARTLLHNFESAARDIGLYVNAGKTKSIGYNQADSVNTLSGNPWNL